MSPKYRKLFEQNYKKIFLEYARTGRNFQDEHFPTNDVSLYKTPNKKHDHHIEWKRCKDLTNNPHLFVFDNEGKGKINTDVVQGAVGNCWLVSAIGVLAAHPKLLHKVIPKASDQDWNHSDEPGKKTGVYHFRDTGRHPGVFRFRFYRFGEWVEVVVDDYLPTRDGKLIYAHSRNPDEMWVSLLEKAYAKLCRCYEALEAGTASDALVDLTGTIPDTIELPNTTHFDDIPNTPSSHCSSMTVTANKNVVEQMGLKNFIMMIIIANKKGALMSCNINPLEGEAQQERLPNGLVIGHAYGITDIQQIQEPFWKKNRKNTILIRLHNPWGEIEWNGAWSDKSEEWQNISKSKRKKMGFKIADDGDFWMSFDDWMLNFSILIICRHLNTSIFSFEKRWHGITFRGEWSIEKSLAGGCVNNKKTFYQNPQYRIVTHKPTTLIIGLMQEDKRANITRENLTIDFVVLKVEENRKYRIHKSTFDVAGRVTYINTREVTARIALKSGNYILIPSTFNYGDEGHYFMRMFSGNRISIKRLEKDKPKKKWWYPLIYWGKSYFVGTIRIKLLSVNLKRYIGKAYIKITFADLNGRIKQRIVSPKFITNDDDDDGGVTDILTEYTFFTRDPSTAGLLFQLYQKNTFSKDKLLGEMRLLTDSYSKEEKVSKMWEITKTFTKTVKIPKSYLTSNTTTTETEGEVSLDECDDVDKKSEKTVTRISAKMNGDRSVKKSSRNDNKRRKRNGNGHKKGLKSKDFVPQLIDANIGELKVRIIYYPDLNS
ncbi:cysteine proteinase [Rhizophagus irregularis]|uniref:Cysteine proteinase n=1 Tax=Rhizophagus irregularis TaxID=588596 RepID=A0A2N0PC49_9GLOM|nr:cysteine proteinase [Rhizophagus irregularis]